MPYDRYEIWRDVASRYAQLEQMVPEGRAPVVEVYISNRERPVVVTAVEPSRDSEYPWLKLHTGDKEQSYVWTYDGHVQRSEIRFRAKGKSKAGFRVAEPGEPPTA